jgi:hypothetical protein
MKVITETELLERIRSFLERHKMAPTTFGRNATGEPQLISSIEGGRSPSLKVVGRVVAYMEQQDKARIATFAPPPPGDGDDQLPFGAAPVNPTGASSPISSATIAQRQPPVANGSCPTAAPAVPSTSCSAADAT